ncbi:MAG TPA: hypothetical protein VJ917_03085 [Saprospiraceae bacterium]|nr:hypothetical protein [Saprospiraceae bacterium]
MKQMIRLLGPLFFLLLTWQLDAYRPLDSDRNRQRDRTQTSSRSANCVDGRSEIDLAVNNVRARLRISGDIWWDGDNGKYVVPRVEPGSGQLEVSSLFAGGVWLGGQQLGGDIFVAAALYGQNGKDYYPGPLWDGNSGPDGQTDQEMCENWDKFFTVDGGEIDRFIGEFQAAEEGEFDCAVVPQDILGWPGKGNPHFFEIHGFELPDNDAGLAGFRDWNDDGIYDPCDGDYPIIEIRKCPDTTYADEMIFWIYNDNGNTHNESEGLPIQMEVQAQAFGFATSDEINDMTFYRYKLINRATESIDSFHFSMWIDADLGCPDDDYIGCDTAQELMYVYNQDATDGISGCNCVVGEQIPTYCNEVPILGVDYFEGPLDEDGNEIGMSSFSYFNRPGTGPTGTTDPQNVIQYYRYLTGTWADGTPLTVGGDGRTNSGIPTRYAFFSPPDEPGGWSMCEEGLPAGDRRTLQTSGPFRLDPGANNFLIIGVVWIPDYDYPCPNINRLLEADAVAQNLFDACFELTDGPDAPNMDIIELDQELILVMSNEPASNNFQENYQEIDLRAPDGIVDSVYKFEGYKVYQLFNRSVSYANLDDPSVSRLVANFDVANGVTTVYNWEQVVNPFSDEQDDAVFVPTLRAEGNDEGIRRTLSVTNDLFATGNETRLINHQEYYYVAIAYAYNNYQQFDATPPDGEGRGQQFPYLQGRRNVGDSQNDDLPYIGTPRPILDFNLNSSYGEGVEIEMTSGTGISNNFVDITDDTRMRMAEGTFEGTISYEAGEAPISVFVYNPLDVVDGDYELNFLDSNGNGEVDDEDRWFLHDLVTGDTLRSTKDISGSFEQIFPDLGISIVLGNAEPFDDPADRNLGVKRPIGAEIVYQNENAEPWFSAVTEDIGDVLQERGIPFGAFFIPQFDFLATEGDEPDAKFDPTGVLGSIGGGEFVPFHVVNFRSTEVVDGNTVPLSYLTPQWTRNSLAQNPREQTISDYSFNELPNVDIVLTSNRDLWSRCIVVDGYTKMYADQGWSSENGEAPFDIRRDPSLLRDPGPDGRPQYDPDETGFSWFPGYAVDVETGERLNIFFGENSAYSQANSFGFVDTIAFELTGDDMIWNPTTDLLFPPLENDPQNLSILNVIAGCQHHIYVTNEPYDGCEALAENFSTSFPPNIIEGLGKIQWVSTPLINPTTPLTSYADGLIPEDLTVKLRVNSPFGSLDLGNAINEDRPVFKFSIDGKAREELDDEGIENALDQINVAPNPYYAYSQYEVNELSNIVKITNLPAECTVNIYSLDGRFIRRYERNEFRQSTGRANSGVQSRQFAPAIEWDLKNFKGIPVASGVYLIHVEAPGLGERVIKWFGVGRAFDASGL